MPPTRRGESRLFSSASNKPQYDVYKTIEYNGKCVGFTQYLDLFLTDCNGQDEQKWAFKRDGRIRNKLLDNYGFDACVLADNFIFPKLRLCNADDDEYFLTTKLILLDSLLQERRIHHG